MAKYVGPCPTCAHSSGEGPCITCGGLTGYPRGVIPQIWEPCDQCRTSIGTTTTVLPLSPVNDPPEPELVLQLDDAAAGDDEATRPLAVLTDLNGPLTITTAPAVHAYEGSPTLERGTYIESWRGLGSDMLTLLGRLAADRGDERANQVALLLHKMLRDEVSR